MPPAAVFVPSVIKSTCSTFPASLHISCPQVLLALLLYLLSPLFLAPYGIVMFLLFVLLVLSHVHSSFSSCRCCPDLASTGHLLVHFLVLLLPFSTSDSSLRLGYGYPFAFVTFSFSPDALLPIGLILLLLSSASSFSSSATLKSFFSSFHPFILGILLLLLRTPSRWHPLFCLLFPLESSG